MVPLFFQIYINTGTLTTLFPIIYRSLIHSSSFHNSSFLHISRFCKFFIFNQLNLFLPIFVTIFVLEDWERSFWHSIYYRGTSVPHSPTPLSWCFWSTVTWVSESFPLHRKPSARRSRLYSEKCLRFHIGWSSRLRPFSGQFVNGNWVWKSFLLNNICKSFLSKEIIFTI